MNKKIIIIVIVVVILFIILIATSLKRSDNKPVVKIEPTIPHAPTSTPVRYDKSAAPEKEYINAMELYKKNKPDFYLANFVPFKTNLYSIYRSVKETPYHHYAFTIVLKSENSVEARQAAKNWMLSLGLTEEQIENLDISYTFE